MARSDEIVFAGRPEKLPDVCYSWWVLASLKIIGRLHWIDRVCSIISFAFHHPAVVSQIEILVEIIFSLIKSCRLFSCR